MRMEATGSKGIGPILRYPVTLITLSVFFLENSGPGMLSGQRLFAGRGPPENGSSERGKTEK
jgi:hypothetical protein